MSISGARNLLLVFLAGGIVVGLAVYLALSGRPKVAPPPLAPAPCGQYTGDVHITAQSSAPGVDCQGVVLHVNDHVTWQLSSSRGGKHFKVKFKGKTALQKDGNDKVEFTETQGDSDGTVKDPCPDKPYCVECYFYSIEVDGVPYDPGGIITKP